MNHWSMPRWRLLLHNQVVSYDGKAEKQCTHLDLSTLVNSSMTTSQVSNIYGPITPPRGVHWFWTDPCKKGKGQQCKLELEFWSRLVYGSDIFLNMVQLVSLRQSRQRLNLRASGGPTCWLEHWIVVRNSSTYPSCPRSGHTYCIHHDGWWMTDIRWSQKIVPHKCRTPPTKQVVIGTNCRDMNSTHPSDVHL